MDDFLVRALAAGAGVALVAGPFGSFVIWRRMAYFGDALAHASLLGVALGFLLHWNLVAGVLAVCAAASLLLLRMQRRGLLPGDAILGILSHGALAAGLVTVSFLESLRVDLVSYLFGDTLAVGRADLVWIWGGGAAALAALAALWRPLLALTVHEELARVEGVRVDLAQTAFVLLLSLVVALMMKVVGILLITALLIIPAAAARRFARSPEGMAAAAALAGCAAVGAGLWGSLRWDTPAGPSVVVAAAAIFAASAALPRRPRPSSVPALRLPDSARGGRDTGHEPRARERRYPDAMIATLLPALLVAVSAAAAAAQPVSFSARTIDAVNAGDNKAVADIDGDGRGDPILGGASLAWYEADASFARRVIRARPRNGEFTTDMQAADMDGDGDPDIVTGDGNAAPNVFWYENPRLRPPAGRGSDPRRRSNWAVHAIGHHGDWAHDIEVGDLDRDGRPDVVTGGHGRTHVWRRAGTGWAHADLSALNGQGIFLADIDRDRDLDIVVPGGWLENPGDVVRGTWVRRAIARPFGDEVFAADFNRDGRIDIGTCSAHAPGDVLWFEAPLNPRRSDWRQRRICTGGAHHPEPADFNGDGWPDLLLGLELSDLSVLINDRDRTFTRVRLDTRAGHNARAGDIDGDGRTDVFGCDYIGNPPARVYLNRAAAP